MSNINNSYLINNLTEGRNVKVSFIADNAYWQHVQTVDKKYENCNINMYNNDVLISSLEESIEENNSEFIVWYSSDVYNEEKIIDIKCIAFSLSQDNDKRISIGYSYIIPEEEREHPNIKEEVKIISFKNSQEIELTFGMGFFTPLDLVEMTIETHDDFENQKILKK